MRTLGSRTAASEERHTVLRRYDEVVGGLGRSFPQDRPHMTHARDRTGWRTRPGGCLVRSSA